MSYRAGPAAVRILRGAGLTAGSVAALAGPASGPRWIVLAGLDRALLESGLLRPPAPEANRRPRPLWVGASAGVWRMLALASRDPLRAHRLLLDGYVGMTFPERVTPAAVSEAYRQMLSGIFPPDEIAHLADHPHVDLAAHVVRPRLPLGWSVAPRAAQTLSLVLTGLLHAVSRSGTDLFFERLLFHTRPRDFAATFGGRVVELTPDNLLAATLATGTVPFYMQPRRDLPGAPRGHYIDGGLSDYHLRQRYVTDGRGITLFPHFQRRIVPAWFDRSRPRRAQAADALDNVLQIHPTDAFLATLPDGRLPDRDDFFRFAANPAERIRRWQEAARLGERLGAEFLNDLEQGRIVEQMEAF